MVDPFQSLPSLQNPLLEEEPFPNHTVDSDSHTLPWDLTLVARPYSTRWRANPQLANQIHFLRDMLVGSSLCWSVTKEMEILWGNQVDGKIKESQSAQRK